MFPNPDSYVSYARIVADLLTPDFQNLPTVTSTHVYEIKFTGKVRLVLEKSCKGFESAIFCIELFLTIVAYYKRF